LSLITEKEGRLRKRDNEKQTEEIRQKILTEHLTGRSGRGHKE
jgi:hypothetical protein